MGKRTEEGDGAFWRSIFLFVIKWIAIGVLPLVAAFGFIKLVLQQEENPGEGQPSPSPIASPATSPTSSPDPSPEPSPSPTPVVRGRLQVLNGADQSGLAQQAADELKAAGFEIVAVERAARSYEKSTVFFQPGQEAMAREAAAVVGAEVIQPAPPNLNPSIPVTVVVGNDYEP